MGTPGDNSCGEISCCVSGGGGGSPNGRVQEKYRAVMIPIYSQAWYKKMSFFTGGFLMVVGLNTFQIKQSSRSQGLGPTK